MNVAEVHLCQAGVRRLGAALGGGRLDEPRPNQELRQDKRTCGKAVVIY